MPTASHNYLEAQTTDPFHRLVQEIKEHLGTSSGIDSEDVDIDYLRDLMTKYTSNPADWQQYAHLDPGKHYTRNYVENINGKANIVSSCEIFGYEEVTNHDEVDIGMESEEGLTCP